jgi:hypothetical protein
MFTIICCLTSGKYKFVSLLFLYSINYVEYMKRETLINKYKIFLSNTVDEYYNNKRIFGRKNKYNNFTYIKPMLRVLFYGHRWEDLKLKNIKLSTVKKKFTLWKNKDIFNTAYQILINKFYKNNKIKTLFTDSFCVQNINCSDEKLSKYYKMPGKNQIKVSIISTFNNLPISTSIDKPTKHDSVIFPKLVNNLRKTNIQIDNNCNIGADKGYISKKKQYFIKNKKVNLITPKRKNQKKRTNKKNKNFLKGRYSVEQTNSHLKLVYKRLQLIYDRKLENYETFLIMALTCQFIRKSENMKIKK